MPFPKYSRFFYDPAEKPAFSLCSGFSSGCGRLLLPQNMFFLNQWSGRKPVQVTGNTEKLLPDVNHGRSFPYQRIRKSGYLLQRDAVVFVLLTFRLCGPNRKVDRSRAMLTPCGKAGAHRHREISPAATNLHNWHTTGTSARNYFAMQGIAPSHQFF